MLPALVRAMPSGVTIIQIDAHADLRDQLDGEKWSHACAAARSLDVGAKSVYQVGIRAYCKQEADMIDNDERVNTWFARDIMSPCTGAKAWGAWLALDRWLGGGRIRPARPRRIRKAARRP